MALFGNKEEPKKGGLMGSLKNIGMNAISGGLSGLMGGAVDKLLGLLGDNQYEQQQKLQDIQIKGAKDLADYSNQKQLELWKATNAGAQRDELERAGLSASLMYGGSGPGGGTTGSGGGGMPTSAGADSKSAMMMARLQTQQVASQIKLTEAQAKKTEAEADNESGVNKDLKTAQIADITAGITNKNAQTKLIRVQDEIADLDLAVKHATFNETVQTAKFIMHQTNMAMRIAQNDEKISSNTIDERIKIVQTELAGALLQNMAIDQNIQMSKAQVHKIAQDILQGWEGLRLQGEGLNIQNFEAKIKAEYPGAWNVIGKAGNDFFEGMMSIFGNGFKPKK